jgi:hypothetical protein
VWEVYNAPANATIDVVASRAGLGSTCLPLLGGSCLGLRGPVSVVGSVTTDASGHARLERVIPAFLNQGTAAFQAVWRGAQPAWLSNTISRDLQAGPAEHVNTVYDDLLAGNWQIEVWPCAGVGAPPYNLQSTARVGSGARALAVNMACTGGYAGVGFDRRTANFSQIWYLYPNQHMEARFRFHHGAAAADDAQLDLTLDLDYRLPLARYLGQPDANGWYDVVVPLAELNPDGERWHRLMFFQAAALGAPEFVVDRFELVWVDDFAPPVVRGLQVTDVVADGATLAFETDEHAWVDVVATGGGVTVEVPGGDFGREHEIAITGLPANTPVSVTIRARDHQETGPAFETVTGGAFTTAAPDLTPPVLSGFRVVRVGATIAEVCWDADELATYAVAFGVGALNRTATVSQLTDAPCANLTALNPLQTYNWSVTATDRAGNVRTTPANQPFTTTATPTAQATVSRAVPIAPFTADHRGVNLGNWTFFWGRPYPDDSPKLRELTRLIEPGVIRHAGGNWSLEVSWDPANGQCYPQNGGCERETFLPRLDGWDTCGPAPVRVPGAYQHAYQADELEDVVSFADRVGAELMIEVNAAVCDPAMWADMVEYTNVVRGWDIRYWEIGNEFDYNAHVAGFDVPTGDAYAERYVTYAEALKAVDPDIEIVGPAASQHEEDPTFLAESDLMLPLLDNPDVAAGDVLDVFSWHTYPQWNGDAPVTAEQLLAFGPPGDLEGRGHLDTCAAEKRGWLDARGLADTTMAITEFQGIVVAAPTVLNVNHAGALYLLDALPRLAASGVDMVLNWELYDDSDETGFGLIRHQESRIWIDPVSGATQLADNFAPNPAWYGYAMLARLFGEQLVATTSSRDSLSVWASTDPARPGDVWVLVINLADDAVVGTIGLGGWVPANGAKAWTLTNPAFVEARDKETVREGTVINGLAVDSSSAPTIVSSWAAIEAAGVNLFPNVNGVTRTFTAYSATMILLDGP